MENQNIEQPEDNRKKTEELLEQSGKLREQTQVMNEKMADLKKRTDEMLHQQNKNDE